jgi:hypothetical protein
MTWCRIQELYKYHMQVRALWETHWREEWLVLYGTHLSSFRSGSKKPGWSIFLQDILGVKVGLGG